MRLLVLDIGNTSIKIGVASEESVLASFSLPTDTTQGGDLLGLHIIELLRQAEKEAGSAALTACIASSVVPAMNPLVRYACERFLGIKAYFAHVDIQVPLENRYKHPTEVGADRLVAAYAARRLFPKSPSVISIDYGTATTFDCVEGKAYLGGLITPGIMSSLSALSTKTAQLPRIPLSADSSSFEPCRDTITSLNQGFLYGFAAMTEGLVQRLKTSMPSPCSVVATGGFSMAISGATSCFTLVRPDLLLDGLRALWIEQNIKIC